jgi:hypothetical protein
MNRHKVSHPAWRQLAVRYIAPLLLLITSNPIVAIAGQDPGPESLESPGIQQPEATPIIDTTPIPAAISNQKLSEFKLSYKLKAFGMSAKAEIELIQTGSDQYQYQSMTQAKGLASLIRPNEAIETSRFHMQGTDIVVDEYLFDSGSGDKLEDSYARFDWQQQIAFGNHQEELRDVPLSPGVLDRMSADLKVTLDLQAGRSPGDYSMVHRNYVKIYTFTELGKEEIKTKAGTFKTIKYLRQRDGSTRSAYIWYAEDLDYQPVKVVQLKKGKVRGTLLLESYRTSATAR